MKQTKWIVAIIMVLITAAAVEAAYYAPDAIYFAFRPSETRGGQLVNRFGPAGLSIELTLPAFGMKIKSVEPGSPAEKSGLKTGQIIDTINGEKLQDIDPRIQLGNMITKAEAKDGVLKFIIRDKADADAREVAVKIPAIGAYSKTWPLNCKKSDKIVTDLADYLRTREDFPLSHLTGPAMLFMLSTGEEKDLAVARRWAGKLVETYKTPADVAPIQNWTVGYAGVPLCEYYLRTGDKSVLPLISMIADHARWDMYNDGWAHGTYQGRRGPDAHMAFPYMGGGHINACGVHVVTFLLMAQACGAEVDEATLQKSFKHFFRFACRGNVPYGDGIPEQSFVDNGKTGGLAFTMAAAARLTPDGENSIYARARDNSAVKGFYSTSWMLIGHTGGGVGEIWRSYSMGLMQDKKPKKHREFMDKRQWFYELSRRHDGSFGIVGGGGRYDKPESWGITMGMSYTAPRKTLQLTGAPRSKFLKPYKLPERAWGNAADDAFCSNVPAMQDGGTVQDVDREVFVTDASQPVWGIMSAPDVSDDVLLKYAHHADHGMRRGAASFIWKHKRDHLVVKLLTSKDPRVRHTGTMAIYCTFKRRPMPANRITDDMVKQLYSIINDADESLWVVHDALRGLSLLSAEQIAPQVDRLLYWLDHEEWWLSAAAMLPLAKVAGDERFCRRILPAVGKIMARNTNVPRSSPVGKIFGGLKSATPEVRKLALDVLATSYTDFPRAAEIHGPDKISMWRAEETMLNTILQNAAQFPDGLNKLFAPARKRFPDAVLPHSRIYMKQDPAKLSPAAKAAMEEHKQLEAQKKAK
ncbi:MAG: hypothetical protein HN919_21065 [Verrucomicrobia bacterium]|jgi:hypothetical protein|nr:hypothetical protein [Verrucomicrobiota bacterium]MBT7068799.1 hypothetical protein [Verrucomicrobiota bacterium]MBT7700453.1 hypothetical protein [Verrucomicrobiota bacterium]